MTLVDVIQVVCRFQKVIQDRERERPQTTTTKSLLLLFMFSDFCKFKLAIELKIRQFPNKFKKD